MGDKRPGKGPKKSGGKDKKVSAEFAKEMSPQLSSASKVDKK